jgi:hypothetical protein
MYIIYAYGELIVVCLVYKIKVEIDVQKGP